MTAPLFGGASPGELWQPRLLLEVVAEQAAYLLCAAGPLRPRQYPAPSRARTACFLAGAALCYLLFGSPVDYLADEVSFAAHMLQHVGESVWMTPLLILGLPPWLASRWRPRPVLAAAAFNGAFLAFHLPRLYAWTLQNPTAHLGEHLLLFGVAAAMWQALLGPASSLSGLRAKLIYLFANAYVMMPLPALMLMAARPWYLSAAALHGLDPLGDQQWGAILMMAGMFMAYAVTAVGLMANAAAASDTATQ